MIIAGIDPGSASGGICVLDSKVGIRTLIDMPVLDVSGRMELNEIAIREALTRYDLSHVFLEKATTMPKQGISSTGRYMAAWGFIKGCCVGLHIPYTLITPQAWKKVMMQGMGKEKDASVVRVQQLFPDIKFPLKKDHNKADSVLIAAYGLKTLGVVFGGVNEG